MLKCPKVKHPCKICLRPVTQKTGLQCQGACETWIHYTCLNYTPGKVKDIKAGIIKITCPCPDCKTSLPREYRIDEPYSCTNLKCPARVPPVCENVHCPSKGEPPHKIRQLPENKPAIKTCGDDCRENAYPNANAPNVCQIQPKPTPQETESECSSVVESVGDTMDSPLTKTVELMCNTVGQLTGQINELMCKLKECLKEVEARSSGKKEEPISCCQPQKKVCQHRVKIEEQCTQKGPKSLCRKPCYCPGNPGQ